MSKIVIIASTAGSVLSKVLTVSQVRDSIALVISDRECGAIEIAKKFNIQTQVLSSESGAEFSEKLANFFLDDLDIYFLSFYTKIFTGIFLYKFKDRVLNFHPSILPICPGINGFEDTIKSGTKFIGSTLHFVDSGIDTGSPLVQSSYPYQPDMSISENRHIVFIQQCKILIQFIFWVKDNRVKGKEIINSKFDFSEFIPNLDSPVALSFTIPVIDQEA